MLGVRHCLESVGYASLPRLSTPCPPVSPVHVAGKDLFSLVERERLSEPDARFYIAEIALALGHMHHYNFIYRDLKSENVMLAMDGHLKLIDLGFARHCPRDSLVRGDFCGTCARSRPRSECILCFELQA